MKYNTQVSTHILRMCTTFSLLFSNHVAIVDTNTHLDNTRLTKFGGNVCIEYAQILDGQLVMHCMISDKIIPL